MDMSNLSALQKHPVTAVVLDVSGTVLDFGCRGPAAVFIELFARHGVSITVEEARRPMGTHKRDHIWTLLTDPSIGPRWELATGGKPDQVLLDQLCHELVPLMIEVLKEHARLIPGVVPMVGGLRARGIKVANTTGFERCMIQGLIPLAAQQGYEPDLWVCSDEVSKGRPAPWMMYKVARDLEVYPPHTMVKVGDTPADIAEGHASGAWVVAVVRSGNEVGCSEEELAALSESSRAGKLLAAQTRLAACGPHYILDSVANLLPVIDAIAERIRSGEMPPPADVSEPVIVEDPAFLAENR